MTKMMMRKSIIRIMNNMTTDYKRTIANKEEAMMIMLMTLKIMTIIKLKEFLRKLVLLLISLVRILKEEERIIT